MKFKFGNDTRAGARPCAHGEKGERRVQLPSVREVVRESGGGAACGSAEESVIISSISDKGSVINTDLVSGSLLASPCAAHDVALA